MFQKLSCLPYVFGSVLACAKSAHQFQKLSYSLCGLCLSLSLLITLPQTVRLFYVLLHSQALQQQYTVLSFSLMQGHGHSHKLTSSRALWYYTVGVLSQVHRPIICTPLHALHCMYCGITLWAYLCEPLVKDSHKRLSLMEKPQYHMLQVM